MYPSLGLYTLFLVIIWWFFIVAKIHAYKFKHFSNYIERVTKTLLVFLVILSIIGYTLIIYIFNAKNAIPNFKQEDFHFNSVNY
jgi:hypothetical protein